MTDYYYENGFYDNCKIVNFHSSDDYAANKQIAVLKELKDDGCISNDSMKYTRIQSNKKDKILELTNNL